MLYRYKKALMLLKIISFILLELCCSLSRLQFNKSLLKTTVSNNSINKIPKSMLIPKPVKVVKYTGPVRHIFFHCLIAFPEISYSKAVGGPLDTDCVTVSEFKWALEELYKNNYVLIDIHSTYEVKYIKGIKTIVDKKIMLPEGKKPLIMSIDDIVYDPKKMGTGMVDKIILDKEGNLATYTKHKKGQEVISYDN